MVLISWSRVHLSLAHLGHDSLRVPTIGRMFSLSASSCSFDLLIFSSNPRYILAWSGDGTRRGEVMHRRSEVHDSRAELSGA